MLSYDIARNADGDNLPLYTPPIVNYFPGTNNMVVPFDSDQNRLVMEISGVLTTDTNTPPDELPVILSGPGVEIERIPGFDGTGNPDDQSGFNREFPIIFEVGAPFLDGLQTWRNDYEKFFPTEQTATHKSASIIILTGANIETFRWNLFELVPFAIEPLPSTRSRVTLYHADPPDNILRLDDDDNASTWGNNDQNNTATDTEVEISGIGSLFAEVAVDTANRTVTLNYDFGEGGFFFAWVKSVAEDGTTSVGKRSMTIKFSEQINYFGCFPISFQYLSGFEQDIKGKQKIIISYDVAEAAVP